MRKIAIIPARSGSKGLPGKNIAPLGGTPLLAWSVTAALEAGIFERTIVSTDSAEYGRIAEQYGAEVIYRSAELASDKASTYMVLADLLQNHLSNACDYFILLQPTSPFRTATHILAATSLFEQRCQDFDFLASVSKATHASILVKPLAADGSLANFDADFAHYRRQAQLDYSPNGAIFIAKPESYLLQQHFFGPRSLAYIMDATSSVDIDTQLDLDFADFLLQGK